MALDPLVNAPYNNNPNVQSFRFLLHPPSRGQHRPEPGLRVRCDLSQPLHAHRNGKAYQQLVQVGDRSGGDHVPWRNDCRCVRVGGTQLHVREGRPFIYSQTRHPSLIPPLLTPRSASLHFALLRTPHTVSPDNLGQKMLAKGMSDYGGTFATEMKYPYAPMNDIVYPVHGGMEDWAYASSWSAKVVQGGCDPTTYGGYAKEVSTPPPPPLNCPPSPPPSPPPHFLPPHSSQGTTMGFFEL